MDFSLILAATDEPSVAVWLGGQVLAWLGVAVGLTFVIFVHELGHFLVAKACGVKCEKFYVGFDFFEIPIPFTGWRIPRSLVKFQWGETEYGLGSLPLGGYVKMLGQDDDPRNAEHEAARIRAAAPSAPNERVQAIAAGTAAEGLVNGQSVEKLTNEALAAAHHAPSDQPAEPPVPAKTTEGKTILLDPRSYPAKSVPARMAIISAGVIMNLIFAVILAAAAFGLGVEEVPAVVGGVTPGGPAWEEGLEPGSKILQIGTSGKPYEHLRFGDLLPAAILNGTDRDLSVFVRTPSGQDKWLTMRPSDRLVKSERRAMLGVAMPYSLEVARTPAGIAHRGPQATPPLMEGDKLVEVAGQPVASGEEAMAILAQNPLDSIGIVVERQPAGNGQKAGEASGQAERIPVVLDAKPRRELGLTMKIGPIQAVRKASPASEAGFQVGDVIRQIDGEPVGDPLSLATRLTPPAGTAEPVSIVVDRKDRRNQWVQQTLTVVPEPPRQSPLQMGGTTTTSIESIGVAFSVTNEVADVTPGGPADQHDLQPGDKVTHVEFLRGADRQAERKLSRSSKMPLYDELDLAADGASWIGVMDRLQVLPPDNKVKLTWARGEKTMSAELQPQNSTTLFDPSRGLLLRVLTTTRTAQDLREALALGARESREQVKQVLAIIKGLVTGRVPLTGISGPGGIIAVAGSFASEGLAPLLIFLTILSANLAVLNFLPIPALDGGHMLFLTAEWIRGKPVDERLQIRLTVAGVICLLTLMVFATAMDIGRFAEAVQRWFP